MFSEFERRMSRDRSLGLAPQPQDGQEIIDRAIALGATSASDARPRVELDPGFASAWQKLLEWGYVLETHDGLFYVATDGSAERSMLAWLPVNVLIIATTIVALLALLVRHWPLRRPG